MYLWGSLHAACPAQFLSTELWPLRVSAHLFFSPCKLSQQVLWSGMALGILLGSLGLPLLVCSHLCMPGLPCTWFREVGGSGLNLSGTNGSHGPQTPGSRPACDTGRQRLSAKLLWKPSGDFTDSDSDDFEEAEGRYFRVSWEKPCWGWGAGSPVGSCPHSGLSPSSSVSSHAALTSSFSSAACLARCSRPLHRLLLSSTRDSCLIRVGPMLP